MVKNDNKISNRTGYRRDEMAVYQAFFEHHPDPAMILNHEDFKIEILNDSAQNLIGCKNMESFPALIADEYQEHAARFLAKVREGETHHTRCVIHINKGTHLMAAIKAVPLVQGREVSGIMMFIKDQTEEEVLKEKIIEKEEKFNSLFRFHPDAVFMLDLHGNIETCNDIIEEYTGLSNSKLTGPFYQFLAPGSRDEARKKFQEVLSGQSVSFNTSFINNNNEELDIHMTNIPIKNGAAITGVLGVAKDITRFRVYEEKLIKTQEDLNFVQFVSNVGNWEYDVLTGEAAWSDQLYRIYGVKDKSECSASLVNYLSMVHRDDAQSFKKNCMDAFYSGKDFSFEYRILGRDGVVRVVHEQGNCIRDENNRVIRMIGTIHDITKYRKTVEKLKQSEIQAQTIYNSLNEIIWSIDIENKVVLFCSEEFKELCGYSLETFLTTPSLWDECIHPDDVKKIKGIMKDVREGKEIVEQYRFQHSSADVTWIDVKAIPFINEDGKLIRLDGIMWDITEKKKAEDKLYRAAFHDYLTGLPNRRKFEESIEEEIARHKVQGQSFALLYLDLDRFKFVNDRLGHYVGDELLKKVTRRLQSRSDNQFIARLSGDEFAVCIRGIQSPEEASLAAEEIIGILEEPFKYRDYDLFISTSIGISIYPEDGEDSYSLVQNADTALSYAKNSGKNTYQLYTREMNQESYRKYCLETDMRKAVEDDEFEVYFQPKVDAKTERITGAEALLRWNHKKWGMISPAEFIPIAEDSGFITEIGTWVLKDVCRQLKQWSADGHPLVPISINISPQHFLKKDVVELVTSYITKYGVEPQWIELEITENSLIHYSDVVRNTMDKLKEMGVKMSLDDFGTGYSALSQLHNFTFDTLKIDQSFIKNVPAKKEDTVITASLIGLAHGLGLNVVAEGVESKEQLAFLQGNGCDQIQGYIYSRPVPVKEFESLVKNNF
ncbi:EAL domain-containing protein [Bacillus salacetis]|uniref:EAL domain-containing protein n=1 Tax=Bacillus salacetis TaxID=2315464 RepID=A0A3A1R3U9_9BACI|nr:GGDEF and EAL domain-containing protein [Bacillus salacetis]RIW37398.1 EAL domain-containing protein [Bacillus salacetis]